MKKGRPEFDTDDTFIAGILNLTQDSFSDGGSAFKDGALRCVERMIEDGADMISSPSWIRLTAKISVKSCAVYGRKGPVLKFLSATPEEAPEDPVATFY